jgi:para-nitrobenzyl esterase
MNTTLRAAAMAALLGFAAVPALALAQAPAPATPAPETARAAILRFPARTGAVLQVSTPAFKDGADIPYENTQYRANTFPGLSWSKGPAGTKSYAVIMQDTELMIRGNPILHWTLFNIPASVTRMDAGMTTQPAGATYGPNYKGANQPYLGPRTPPGPKHHYHIQVFALDAAIAGPAAGSSFEALTGAINGHVLASGEVVGLGSADPTAPPPPPRPVVLPVAPAAK